MISPSPPARARAHISIPEHPQLQHATFAIRKGVCARYLRIDKLVQGSFPLAPKINLQDVIVYTATALDGLVSLPPYGIGATFSSDAGPEFAAKNCVDGLSNTVCKSAATDLDAWLVIDYGPGSSFSSIEIVHT